MQKIHLRRTALALACGLAALIQPAHAETETSGTILNFETVSSFAGAPGNGDLRVWVNGVPSFCPGATDGSWSFVNANDANFKGVMATITLAYTLGKSVRIGAKPQPIGSGTYCGISYVILLP